MNLSATVTYGLVLVAFYPSITPDEIDFMDPLRGRVKMSRKDFLKWVDFEPFFMSVQKAEPAR